MLASASLPTSTSQQAEAYPPHASASASASQQPQQPEPYVLQTWQSDYLKYLPKGTLPQDVDWSLYAGPGQTFTSSSSTGSSSTSACSSSSGSSTRSTSSSTSSSYSVFGDPSQYFSDLGGGADQPEEEPPGPSSDPDTDAEVAATRRGIMHDESVEVHMVQWYPGHIARAERQLKEQLKMVDVVLEVRDARIPVSTFHPQVPAWCGSKRRLLVMNRVDMISKEDRRRWDEYFRANKLRVFWTDGKAGTGVQQLREALASASEKLNEPRLRRGLQPRPVRACVIGFPNIGKSALINRLLQRKVVDSAPLVGVTRMLRWVRLAGKLDLLDAPGVIPASFHDQVGFGFLILGV